VPDISGSGTRREERIAALTPLWCLFAASRHDLGVLLMARRCARLCDFSKAAVRRQPRLRHHRHHPSRDAAVDFFLSFSLSIGPWTVEETDACFIVKDHAGQVPAYVYFEGEAGRLAAAKLLNRDEARRTLRTSPSCHIF
jgi:hypothetical protein